MTRDLVRTLTRVGVDEIALFIVTPVPGSAFDHEWGGYDTLSDLNFSPVWRSDYRALNRYRIGLYTRFLFWKLIHHPGRLLRQVANFMRRRFETKMEMVPYRAMAVTWLGRRAR